MAARPSIFAVLTCLAGGALLSCMYFSTWFVPSPPRPPSMRSSSVRVSRTCKPSTRVTLLSPGRDALTRGSLLHFRIADDECTPDGGGGGGGEVRPRASGGAFWSARLESVAGARPTGSTAGHFADHGNGTYSLYLHAGWAGPAAVSLTRVLSGKATAFLRRAVWPAEERVTWRGYYRTSEGSGPGEPYHQMQRPLDEMPQGHCRLRDSARPASAAAVEDGGDDAGGECEYPHPEALGETVLACQRPPGVTSCDSLVATKSDSSWISAKIKELVRGHECLFSSCGRYREKVDIAEPAVYISDSKNNTVPALPKCAPDQDLPLSHGYWLDGRWHSLVCRVVGDWTASPSTLARCLRDRHLVLLGDSTTRQWFVEIHALMGLPFRPEPGEAHFSWARHHEGLNATLRFQAHPLLVGSLVVRTDEVRYEVDAIAELASGRLGGGCDFFLLISPWAHFSQWTEARYAERTRRLRDSLAALRRRCPAAKVVLKGPHARDHPNLESAVYGSDFILKQIERINRDVLRGVGVMYLPVWALNEAYPARNTIHMPTAVIREELKMFFSYVCGDE